VDKKWWFLKPENTSKPTSSGSEPRTALGELTALPIYPSWWGGGALSPKTQSLLSGLGLQPLLERVPPPVNTY